MNMQSLKQVLESLTTSPSTKAVFEVMQSAPVEAWLVGESLRELLLATETRIYRFVIKTDPEAFAAHLNAVMPSTVHSFAAEGRNVSIYEGETGTFEFSCLSETSLKEHLNRLSEFTIDSLALDLKSRQLLDFCGGEADLRDRLVRLNASHQLQAESGEVMFKAVRLTLECPGFTLVAPTAILIKSSQDLLSKVGDPARLGYELWRILRASDYLRGIMLLNELGLLHALFTYFLPCALAPVDDRDETVEMSRYTGRLGQVCAEMDELTPDANDFLTKNTHLLRYAALLAPRIRDEMLLETTPEDRHAFIVERGEQVERQMSALVTQVSSAFRVRMILNGYLVGISRIPLESSDLNDLIETVEYVIDTFGNWKGLLSSLLICADWLSAGEASEQRAQWRTPIKELLERQASFLTTHAPSPHMAGDGHLLQMMNL
jgi:tRNA nucleotidyltransferase/poly(A) polymerase